MANKTTAASGKPGKGSVSFLSAGTEKSQISVQISYRIIELFSQGLYRSPNKAIEELVSNAYDAGATDWQVNKVIHSA